MEHTMTTAERGIPGEGAAMLTVEDIARELQVSPESVRRWIHAGELPAVDVACRNAKKRLFRVRRQALDEFLESRQTKTPRIEPRVLYPRHGHPRVKNHLGL